MKIDINSLKLFCRQSEELLIFGSRLSFFHGEMSTGKSTIAEMINYCLGGSLVKTPAINSEVIGAQLDLTLGDATVVIDRSTRSSTGIELAWESGKEKGLENLPLAASQNPVIGEDIFNFSDFMLRQLGLPLLKVRKRKADQDSDMQRLSYRDFFKFCYLDQSDLDSSFFLLEQPIRMEKSKDVLRYVLGFHSDRLSDLQSQLAEVRLEQRSMRDAAKQIGEFLGRYGFSSEEEIAKEIDDLNEQAERLDIEIEKQTLPVDLELTVVEEDERKAKKLGDEIQVKREAVVEIETRIKEQESLIAEFMSLKLKAARSSTASELLAGADFHACPACGTELEKPRDAGSCILCKSDLSDAPGALEGDGAVIGRDLSDRIDDLKRSVTRLKRSHDRQILSLSVMQEERAASLGRIDQIKRQQESEYMQRARQLESERGANRERRSLLMRIKEMPNEVQNKLKAADELSSRIAEIEREIEKEQERFAEGHKNARALETNFHSLLQAIHFPEIKPEDKVHINQRSWLPYILPKGNEQLAWTFGDAGSGGKMVLFKICFALALHLTAAQRNLPLPQIIIIDSPMKNITPDINPEVFEFFYQELYRLLLTDLKEWQCIIIDQTYHEPPDELEEHTERRLTKDDPNYPPLISYYHGH